MIDNESGEAVESPEVLLFPKAGRSVFKGKAVAGKIVFKGLEDQEYGLLAINDGYKNSWFRISVDCGALGDSGRKNVLLPLWKGEGNKTMVLEFAEGEEHLKLKDLGLTKEDDSASLDAPTRISKGIVNGAAIRLYRPEYPEAARSMRLRGEARVKITIGYDGKVESAELVKGNKIFRDAVEDAAKRSEFAPTFLMGVPVKVQGVLVYQF
ncbi:MAG: energy transducer TonB [Acidobacteriota bacterium]|nr:MAG: energy transducer TonB [Acidobacteriota bacterium]